MDDEKHMSTEFVFCYDKSWITMAKHVPHTTRVRTTYFETTFLSGLKALMPELVAIHNLCNNSQRPYTHIVRIVSVFKFTTAPSVCKYFPSELFPDAIPPVKPMAVTLL